MVSLSSTSQDFYHVICIDHFFLEVSYIFHIMAGHPVGAIVESTATSKVLYMFFNVLGRLSIGHQKQFFKINLSLLSHLLRTLVNMEFKIVLFPLEDTIRTLLRRNIDLSGISICFSKIHRRTTELWRNLCWYKGLFVFTMICMRMMSHPLMNW